MKDEFKCQICKRVFKKLQGLGNHLKTHKITKKDYYTKYIKQENEGKCLECGKETSFEKLSRGFNKYCSLKCSNNSEKVKNKIKESCLKNNGVKYPMQSKEIRIKSKQTCLERYGFEYAIQNENVKENKRKSCLEKYGVEYPSQNEEIKEKKRKYCFEKTGYEYTLQNPEVKDKSKKTCLEKYGVDYPLQNKEIFDKNQRSAFKFKDYLMPSGDIRQIQGYEHHALDILIEQYNEEDILTHKGVPTIKYVFEDKNKVYYPDIYISYDNIIIEVKSLWTYEKYLDKNLTKQQACLDQGYDFEFWIFNRKGNLSKIKS